MDQSGPRIPSLFHGCWQGGTGACTRVVSLSVPSFMCLQLFTGVSLTSALTI